MSLGWLGCRITLFTLYCTQVLDLIRNRAARLAQSCAWNRRREEEPCGMDDRESRFKDTRDDKSKGEETRLYQIHALLTWPSSHPIPCLVLHLTVHKHLAFHPSRKCGSTSVCNSPSSSSRRAPSTARQCRPGAPYAAGGLSERSDQVRHTRRMTRATRE